MDFGSYYSSSSSTPKENVEDEEEKLEKQQQAAKLRKKRDESALPRQRNEHDVDWSPPKWKLFGNPWSQTNASPSSVVATTPKQSKKASQSGAQTGATKGSGNEGVKGKAKGKANEKVKGKAKKKMKEETKESPKGKAEGKTTGETEKATQKAKEKANGKKKGKTKASAKYPSKGPYFYESADHSDAAFRELRFWEIDRSIEEVLGSLFPEYKGHLTGVGDTKGNLWSLEDFVGSSPDPFTNYHIVCGKLKTCRHCEIPFDYAKNVGGPCPSRGNGALHETEAEMGARVEKEAQRNARRADRIAVKYKGCKTCLRATPSSTHGLRLKDSFGEESNVIRTYECKKCKCLWTDHSGLQDANDYQKKALEGPHPPEEMSLSSTGSQSSYKNDVSRSKKSNKKLHREGHREGRRKEKKKKSRSNRESSRSGSSTRAGTTSGKADESYENDVSQRRKRVSSTSST